MYFIITILLLLFSIPLLGQQTESYFQYNIATSAIASNGDYAPLWLTANHYGENSVEAKQFLIKAGLEYQKELKHSWRIDGGVELAGGYHLSSHFWIQQAYADFSWKKLSLCIGNKKQEMFPFDRDPSIGSGQMLEGINARPIPQIRGAVKEYITIPGTKRWLAFKGHISYGWFTDGNWQDKFIVSGQHFTKNVLYHSKSLLVRVGNRDKIPADLEFGLLMNSQFGGKQYKRMEDGSNHLTISMPHNLKAYWKAFLPSAGGSDSPVGEQVNVEGNMQGSWNFALTCYIKDWKFKTYLEHYFDDHSQMFFEYGRWKDGQLGIEITPPSNRFVSAIVWEGLATKDQTGPILYDSSNGSFQDVQMSGKDDYFNHYLYQAWQHYGNNIGNPLIPGPAYNKNGEITFRSNRVRANHLGIKGKPAKEWSWRMLTSFARHWGTYFVPLDKQRKQFNGMVEFSYQPEWGKGWGLTTAVALDRGNYLGNSTGGMLTLKKTGGFGL